MSSQQVCTSSPLTTHPWLRRASVTVLCELSPIVRITVISYGTYVIPPACDSLNKKHLAELSYKKVFLRGLGVEPRRPAAMFQA